MEVKCPICRRPIDWKTSPWKPFCSERCKMIDLGAWATGDYFIPGKKEEEEDGAENDPGTKEDLTSW